MPRSGCSALHGVNPNFLKKWWTLKSLKKNILADRLIERTSCMKMK